MVDYYEFPTPLRPDQFAVEMKCMDDPIHIKNFLVGLAENLGDEFIVMGGWGVWAYEQAEMSHDGDAMISNAALSVLRDDFQVTTTPQKKTRQFRTPEGYDIDLYVEHQHGLKVPFDELQAYSRDLHSMRVASPEHLLVLKLDAAKGRRE